MTETTTAESAGRPDSATKVPPLYGRAALVTGGSRGIGAAVAVRLAEAGADVAVTYREGAEAAGRVAKEVESYGRRALAVRADAADPQAVAAAVDHVAAAFGRLDVLVNNAGMGLIAPLDQVLTADVERMLAVNVHAPFAASRAAARHLGVGGRIVTIGSCLADRVAFPGATLYALSKTAMVGMTKGLARELGPLGVTANVVHPGPIDTDMNPADGPGAEFQRGLTVMGRYGTPDDVAATVVHLAGPGGRYITGAAIAVDGGLAV
ncbi:SDR family NAD(P)-dependent oxidoreductase [Allonocardiopsis opalescens]|uniref:NAD(P)-dependent dehydrogenase (Short-subunit alcohol dehydrogenase family) n=1 Tax=Allonocardiopsis opalescens TaxID=1144618 RepID=A0A2T0PW71_9ACTN|nr:SDR family oxidoreductase [Allonocardiopsis opalescens]PRX95782.1 NAD(P)-dependent dehydrogenase (short-subunit alcohol dehydrogenase family) [Allonocardiopsis opalescens]